MLDFERIELTERIEALERVDALESVLVSGLLILFGLASNERYSSIVLCSGMGSKLVRSFGLIASPGAMSARAAQSCEIWIGLLFLLRLS